MTKNKRYIDDGFEEIEDQSFTDTETDRTYYVDYFDEIVDLLNNQDKQIKELEEENALIKGRIINAMVESNKVECSCSPCVCEEYVKKELMRG